MSDEVIKSFLVGLGFGVDESSLAKFNRAIGSATLKVAALFGVIDGTTGAIAGFTTQVSKDFERLGYEYHIIAPAINKALLLRRELLKAYSAAGINISEVVRNSLRLNLSLTKTRFAFKAIYESVASRFFPLLTQQSDLLRAKLYANMPKIQLVLERFIKGLFHAFDATIQLGTTLFSVLGRIYDFFFDLDKATDGWSTIVLGLVTAWKFLNLEFLATPLGMLAALAAAILVLYDDFKTFGEGGKSFFNWTAAIPYINAVTGALRYMWSILQGISDTIGNLILSVYQLFKGDFSGAGSSLVDAFKRLLTTGNGLDLAAANFRNTGPGGIPLAPPLGGNTANNSQQNLNVSQQNNTTIVGVPNAESAEHARSYGQYLDNLSLVRDLKGSVKPGVTGGG